MNDEKNIQMFVKNLDNILNNSSLTISIIFYIFKDYFKNIEKQYYNFINNFEENKETENIITNIEVKNKCE